MNKVVFITNHMGVQGSYLNHLDLQQHLKDNGHPIKFYCENIERFLSVIQNTRRNYTFYQDEIEEIQKEMVEYDVVITDFKSLITINQLGYWIVCKKLLVMDSIELTYHLKEMKSARFFYDVDIYKMIKQIYADQIIFLMPPNNYHIFKQKYPDLNVEVFFKNINVNILKTLKHEDRDGYFFRWDDCKNYDKEVKDRFGEEGSNFEPDWKLSLGRKIPLKYNETDHIFDYKTFVYRRRRYLEYQEQFGRLLFEYILLGKTVYFMGEPYTDDGLTDYLKHFDIKFDNSNKIITTKEELEKRMENYANRPWIY